MSKYIDMHCHWPTDIPSEYDGVVINATDTSQWPEIVARTRAAATVWGAIGIHPACAAAASGAWPENMQQILRANPHLMVGEIGLDKNQPGADAQIDLFARQLNIAHEFSRTTQIHCVGMWDILLHILGRMPRRIIMHAFGGSADIMHTIGQRHDAYFSFSPRVMDTKYKRMRECAAVVPLQRILTESDGMAGTRGADIVNEIAQLRALPADELADIIYENSQKVLNNG